MSLSKIARRFFSAGGRALSTTASAGNDQQDWIKGKKIGLVGMGHVGEVLHAGGKRRLSEGEDSSSLNFPFYARKLDISIKWRRNRPFARPSSSLALSPL